MPIPQGRLILMLVRRTINAAREYISGRAQLLAYLEKLPQTNNHFLRALDATTSFEQCMVSATQVIAFLGRLVDLSGSEKFTDDRAERLRLIANRSKHFDEDLIDTKITNSDITAPVWLTNNDICCTKASVSYLKLHSLLNDLLSIVKRLS